ncbi:MAG TPA: hypothetical protein VK815_02020 [Candidatus Acidoferrales bacterium]|jgi:hypothetical protein|nr:hypothetical protein [Candidatus Acidoferrales bacterium]
MNILATVIFGKNQITATWKFKDGNPHPFLIINTDQDGNDIVIKLNSKSITDVDLKQKAYVGSVRAEDAYILKNG